VPDKDLVFDRHAGADESVRRDLAAGADIRAALYLDEGADARIRTDRAAVQIHKVGMKNLDPLGEADILTNWHVTA
jgi:hypothetical protein